MMTRPSRPLLGGGQAGRFRSATRPFVVVLTFLIITLTTIAPAISQAQSTKKPSKIIHLESGFIGTTAFPTALEEIGSNGASLGAYTVPAGQVLVVTSVTVQPVSSNGTLPLFTVITLYRASPSQSTSRISFPFLANEPFHRTYPTGIVFASGSELQLAQSGGNGFTFTMVLTGYLAPDV